MTITKIDEKDLEKKMENFINASSSKSTKDSRVVSLYMSKKLIQALDNRAKELGLTRSALIKFCCSTYLENE